jgi:hypothetical protein
MRKNLDKVSVVGRIVELLEQMFETDVRKLVKQMRVGQPTNREERLQKCQQ